MCYCVGVGVIAQVRKNVCVGDSLDFCRKVCVCVWKGGERGRGECACECDCGYGCNCVSGCECDCVGEEGSVWVGQP